MPDVADPRSPELEAKLWRTPDWAHELKYHGYRMHAQLVRGEVRLLTRTGLDWADRYGATAKAKISWWRQIA
jgi:bifunctional non-homologous end joining protein LigD